MFTYWSTSVQNGRTCPLSHMHLCPKNIQRLCNTSISFTRLKTSGTNFAQSCVQFVFKEEKQNFDNKNIWSQKQNITDGPNLLIFLWKQSWGQCDSRETTTTSYKIHCQCPSGFHGPQCNQVQFYIYNHQVIAVSVYLCYQLFWYFMLIYYVLFFSVNKTKLTFTNKSFAVIILPKILPVAKSNI